MRIMRPKRLIRHFLLVVPVLALNICCAAKMPGKGTETETEISINVLTSVGEVVACMKTVGERDGKALGPMLIYPSSERGSKPKLVRTSGNWRIDGKGATILPGSVVFYNLDSGRIKVLADSWDQECFNSVPRTTSFVQALLKTDECYHSEEHHAPVGSAGAERVMPEE